MSDPSSFISNPPSTVVKVVNTSRAELNGLLGIAVQFDAGRGRYLIHMVNDQQTMALKPENLVKASTMESIKAQYQQFQNDPRMKGEIQKYHNLIQTKTGIKPQYLFGAVLALIVMAIYWFGFSKTLMLLSTMLLLAILAGPDLIQGAGYKTVLRNFPMRSREAIEQSAPFLKGRITNSMAAALVAVMVVFSLQSLIFGGGARKVASTAAAAATAKGTTYSLATVSSDQLEQAYKLGFNDATSGKEFGFSSVETLIEASKLAAMDAELDDEFASGGYASRTTITPPPPQRSFISKIGFSQAMSAFYLYRTAMEIGTDANGRFSPQLFLAQVQTQEVWKLGILGFTMYNLLKVFW
jgi:hypothetical protein